MISKRKISITIILIGISIISIASKPKIKLDINYFSAGRDYTENGYIAWEVEKNKSFEANGVKFSIESIPGYGTISTHWYKQGINEGNLLVSDGLKVSEGDKGTKISLKISGLPTGNHTILVYFNHVDNVLAQGGACPIDIFINNKLIADNLQPSLRTSSKYQSQKTYINFEATEGENVELIFKTDIEKGVNKPNKSIMINAIELNTPDIDHQASHPFPTNANEHVIAENKSVELAWTADDEAVEHIIYFSSNEKDVEEGKAKLIETSETKLTVNNLNTHNTYYWRVDEKNINGTITQGEVWKFRTAQLAFPSAQGYGRFARGGRGGRVVHITNLNDNPDNPEKGSLRYAIEIEKGPRTIVFDISGIIQLKKRLSLSDNYVTIAGQTAPGKGICLRDAPFGLSGANDVIMQNLRIRRGKSSDINWGGDGTGMAGCYNSIIDHCSVSWTIDEAFSSRNGGSITLQNTLISETLSVAGHPNYPKGKDHGYAATIGGNIGSYHHNLLAHNSGRNWSIGGGLDGNAFYAGRLDIRNNVVYNWKTRTTDGGAKEVNFVNNYYKAGPATELFYTYTVEHEGTGKGKQQAYYSGNELKDNEGKDLSQINETSEGIAGRRYKITNNAKLDWNTWVDKPFFPSYVETQSAKSSYKRVLSNVGCTSPVIDEHDKRMIKETLEGTYTYRGSESGIPGLIDDEKDSGAWEDYPQIKRDDNWDTDKDGMPNWWEDYYKLNNNIDDSNIVNEDGYSNLEYYLHWLLKPHYIVSANKKIKINLKDLFFGYDKNPRYKIISQNKEKTIIKKGILELLSKESKKMITLTIEVIDDENDTMQREIVVYFK